MPSRTCAPSVAPPGARGQPRAPGGGPAASGAVPGSTSLCCLLSFPHIHGTEKSLILPPGESTLGSTSRQQKLAFAIERATPCEESTGMGHRPSAWLTELVESVAGYMEAHSPMGALGWRYHAEDELAALIVYPTPVELVGGDHDGAIVMPGFSLDVQALQAVCERVTALHWHAQGFSPDDEDGPSLALEGTYQDHLVWLRVL